MGEIAIMDEKTHHKIIDLLKAWIANKKLWRRVICTILILCGVASIIIFAAFRSCEITNEGGSWRIKSQTTLKAKVPGGSN